MKKPLFLCLFAMALSCISVVAQQSQPSAQSQMQPLTFWYGYSVNPGKEDEFLDIVKTVGQPVRDKLMADGVVLAWGVQSSLLRVPGGRTHYIWYAVADYASLEKVDNAMRAQIAKLTEEASKSGPAAAKKGQKPAAAAPMARLAEIADLSKTHDFLTRDLVIGLSSSAPANVLPFTRYNFVKAKPGKAGDYRKAWEKYNKPIFDKLLADGVILAYGLAVEDVRTEGDFTHFVWYDVRDLASFDKVRAAFVADRDHRSQEEQDAITHLFVNLTDTDASRSEIGRSLIFHVATSK